MSQVYKYLPTLNDNPLYKDLVSRMFYNLCDIPLV
jgi:hypothetical protein